MKRILIFSGTSEGRKLAERLSEANIPAVVCVATEYGEQVMGPLTGISLHCGRMDRSEMLRFMQGETFLVIVDATHPFATEVSENIRHCAQECHIPYLRLRRDTTWRIQDMPVHCDTERQFTRRDRCGETDREEQVRYFDRNETCAEELQKTEGNILLTTGSKELRGYCEIESLRERLYVRVLPNRESIDLCQKAGLRGSQIIAMQGPFSEEMNRAVFHQYHIRHMVTKESGKAGGFEEKARAAEEAGVCLYVIGNPERGQGLSMEDILDELEKRTGKELRKKKETDRMQISLIGIGMGNRGTLSREAEEKIGEADHLFGAERMLESIENWNVRKEGAKSYPFYRAKDIIGKLEERYQEMTGKEIACQAAEGLTTRAAVLFSGDSGFYSGCAGLYEKLQDWKKTHPGTTVRIYPGISSVAYFAARCGLSWQDAELVSIHGKKDWEAEMLCAVRYHKKVFVLVSGVEDVRRTGKLLQENSLSECKILVGYQLSYPEERVEVYSPEQCSRIEGSGLYVLFIINEDHEKYYLAPHRRDVEFIRGKVPMTKEEIRVLAVCKLRLTEDAIVYDIGSGTGSVAIETAGRSAKIRVFAIDKQPEGLELIRQNREGFGFFNIKVINGEAPEALDTLPAPTHAFIGGSGGRLAKILEALYRKNPSMRIVMTAVSLETLCGIREMLAKMPVRHEEIVQIQANRIRRMGEHHLMQAENPVFICSFDFCGGEREEI